MSLRRVVTATRVLDEGNSTQGVTANDPRTVEDRICAYEETGINYGLAEALAKEDAEIGLRLFLLDNSGSTAQGDGHVLQSLGGSGYCESIPATRWEEVCSLAIDQATWNASLGVRCEFLLLNSPDPDNPEEGRDFSVVDPRMGHVADQVRRLYMLLEKNGPKGVTPITPRLQSLQRRLLHGSSIPVGARVYLCIVTDGLPTSTKSGNSSHGDRVALVEQLRQFIASLNACVVVRLCSDDDDVIDFYNSVDEEMELAVDILDDIQGEGQEVFKAGNGWFAYTPLIHRIREGGTTNKLFDLIDERPLNTVEIAKFLEILLRHRGDPPFPRSPDALLDVVRSYMPKLKPVFDGRLCKMADPVDMKLLRRRLKPYSRSCSVM